MKKVKQFRYYSDGNPQNYPNDISLKNLVSGSIFTQNKIYPIVQLSIYSLPGTKFYLNKGRNPIFIDSTGLFELTLQDGIEINQLNFDLETTNLINDNDESYLVINVIYDTQE